MQTYPTVRTGLPLMGAGQRPRRDLGIRLLSTTVAMSPKTVRPSHPPG